MIIGTAGHIDHGKSALVTALTGRRVDRLAEEQRRGITIELNFAPLELPGLPPAGIVDVPGHEDFVRTMVAGATGIDLVLLVVDLNEGVRPQTEEHLAVAEQLRIPRGIPVFTKADLVEEDWAALVVADTLPRLRASPVAFAEPAVVSAVTGQGIDALRARLAEAIAAAPARQADDRFRMPVDRAFSLAGVGTVVTGTAWSGRVRVGDSVRLLPSGRTGRVRSIESHGVAASASVPGSRTALGLAGVDREAVGRGDAAVLAEEPWEVSAGFDAEVELLPSAPRPLMTRTRVRVHVGTAELLARVYPRGPIAPGGRGLARLALEGPGVVRGGDRFVIRSYSPVTTIGGGEVLDPLAPRRAAWPAALADRDPAGRLAALVSRRRDGLPLAQVPQVLGCAPAAGPPAARAGVVELGDRLLAPETVARLEHLVLAAVQRHHAAAPDEPGLSLETVRRSLPASGVVAEALLGRLVAARRLVVADGRAARPGFVPAVEGGDAAVGALVERLEQAGLEPPPPEELARDLGLANPGPVLRLAVEQGRVAQVERDRYFATAALDGFRRALVEIAAAGPITPAAVRARLGLSRKFSIPLLEWADRRGITRRQGDERILVDSGS